MKYINNYQTKAEYTADANRPTTKSTVSNLQDGNGVIFEGKNILVDKPGTGIGDIVVFNTATNSVQFIKYGTYNAATLPAYLTILGVVYYRTENRVNIVSKNNQASARWAEGYKVKLAGFDMVNGGSFTVTVNSTTTAAITYTSADTLSTIATAIATALTAVGFTSATGWSTTADNVNNCIVIIRHYYTPVISTFNVADAASKVVATVITTKDYQCTLSGLLTAYSSITRIDGSTSSWAGANFPKFYSYYHDNGGANTNEALKSGNVVKYAVFNVTDNPILIGYYGSGEAGYTAYIKDKMLRYPYSKGSIIDDNGQSNTSLLAPVMYIDIDGSSKPAYPAAYNAKQYGVAVSGYTTGFEVGNWWLPSCREMYLLIKDALLDNSDIVNKALTAISGDKVLASGYYPWISTEYNAGFAWGYNGNSGSLNNTNKFTNIYVRAVTAF